MLETRGCRSTGQVSGLATGCCADPVCGEVHQLCVHWWSFRAQLMVQIHQSLAAVRTGVGT